MAEHADEGKPWAIEREKDIKTPAGIIAALPSGTKFQGTFNDRLKGLVARYPYWIIYDKEKAGKPVTFLGADLESLWFCHPYGCLPLAPTGGAIVSSNGDWLTYRIAPDWKLRVDWFDRVDNQEYWAEIDFSGMFRTDRNSYGVTHYTYNEYRKSRGTKIEWGSREWWNPIPTPVTTTLTRGAWERLKKSPMLGGIDDADWLFERLEAQLPQ